MIEKKGEMVVSFSKKNFPEHPFLDAAPEERGARARGPLALGWHGVLAVTITLALLPLGLENYLLFHAVVELGAATVALLIAGTGFFATAQASCPFLAGVGVVFSATAFLDVWHTLAFQGMGVFPTWSPDHPVQLWVLARTTGALGLLATVLWWRRPGFFPCLLLGTGALVGGGAAAVVLGAFPACFSPETGLTTLKIVAEYAVVAILLLAMGALEREQDGEVAPYRRALQVSLAITVLSELCFTVYADLYGLSNMAGHLLKVLSSYALFVGYVLRIAPEVCERRLGGLLVRLRLREENLRTALAEREALLREVHHRVKNNIQVVSSLLSIQSGRSSSPEVQHALQQSRGRIAAMGAVHSQIYTSGDFTDVDMGPCLQGIVAHLRSLFPEAKILFQLSIEGAHLPVDLAVPCALILNELLFNACQHAFPGNGEGIIRVDFSRSAERGTFTVADNGVGIPGELLERKGMGLTITETLVQQLEGTFDMVSGSPGVSARFSFPLPPGGPPVISELSAGTVGGPPPRNRGGTRGGPPAGDPGSP